MIELFLFTLPSLASPDSVYRSTVKVGNDQKMAQSERKSYHKNRGGKKLNRQLGTYTKKTYRKPSQQLFSNRRSLIYPKLTKI